MNLCRKGGWFLFSQVAVDKMHAEYRDHTRQRITPSQKLARGYFNL